MFTLFRCVAESVVAKGLGSLARELPFGSTVLDIASDAWKRLRARKAVAEMRAEVQEMAQAAQEDVRKAAAEAAREAFPEGGDRAIELELYLSQIPAAVRQSLRRSDDPTGTTVPAAFALDTPESLLPLLPTRVSKFRPGDALPGREGWKLTELLGTGGFGEVWLAAHPHFASLRRAVKFCLELTDRDRTLLHEGGLIDRVMRAGPVPNVVPLVDANLTGDAPWLMYEYVAGGDLVGLVASWRDLPADARQKRAVAALKQIAGAVAHFHRLGVVHRDLKPANILVAPGGAGSPELKVADFGIGGISAAHELEADRRATSTGTRLATVGRGAYTPLYAAPQQKKGNAPEPRDDVFALGVIGYQMLAGDVTAERPGGKGWRRELQSQGVQTALLDLLESCWDDSPEERPADAGELLARLERIDGKVPPPVPAVPAPRVAPPPVPAAPAAAPAPHPHASWRKPVVWLVALALVVGGIITVWALQEEGGQTSGPPVLPSQILGEWNVLGAGGLKDSSTVWHFMTSTVIVRVNGKTLQEGSYTLRDSKLVVQWSADGPMTYSAHLHGENTLELVPDGKAPLVRLQRPLK
jgi:hypothetical protein